MKLKKNLVAINLGNRLTSVSRWINKDSLGDIKLVQPASSQQELWKLFLLVTLHDDNINFLFLCVMMWNHKVISLLRCVEER